MALVRFATVCDKCTCRSEQYGHFALCSECLEDTCPDCDILAERTEDERNRTMCKGCHAEMGVAV